MQADRRVQTPGKVYLPFVKMDVLENPSNGGAVFYQER